MIFYMLTAIVFGLFAYHFVDGFGELFMFLSLQVFFLPVVYFVFLPAFPWICAFLVGVATGGTYRVLKSKKEARSNN